MGDGSMVASSYLKEALLRDEAMADIEAARLVAQAHRHLQERDTGFILRLFAANPAALRAEAHKIVRRQASKCLVSQTN